MSLETLTTAIRETYAQREELRAEMSRSLFPPISFCWRPQHVTVTVPDPDLDTGGRYVNGKVICLDCSEDSQGPFKRFRAL